MRPILQDVRTEMRTARYRAWALIHRADAKKIGLELTGKRRPLAGNPYARLLIEAIRVGIEWDQPPAKPADPKPADPAPPATLLERGRNVMFTAWNPEVALRAPKHWRIALSADPSYDQEVRAAAPKIRAAGHQLYVWGVQTQVGAQRIKKLAAELQADLTIYQAEVPAEYDSAIVAGATMLIGNPNAWTDQQRADAKLRGPGKLATIFEVYANDGAPWPDTASSRGVPVASEALGVGFGRIPHQLADYKPHTPPGVWQTMSVYLAERLDEASWSLLP